MAHAHGLMSGLPVPVAPCAAGNRRPTLRQHAGLFGQQHQQHRIEVQHHHTTPQVAAYPAFTDDKNRPAGGGAVTATGPTELPQQQQQQEGQPDQQQRGNWFVQPPWGTSNGQQQQQHQQQEHSQLQWEQQQQRSRLQDDVSAAMQLQDQQQQQQPPEQQPQSSGDAFIDQLQQCAEVGDVAALVRLQQQQEQEQLTLPQACAVLQQLCSVTRVATLTTRQQQQLQACCCTVAETSLRELPRLGHTEMGQLLAMYQVLGFKPEGAWVRSVLQHAGTELVHYTPAELSLLLLTATQASARCGVIPGPDTPVVQLQPSKRVSPTSSFDAFAAAVAAPSAAPFTSSSSSSGRQQPFLQQPLQQTPQQQQQRRANTVLTSAWLQHFLATFQPYIACRSAHPQLAPGHMEAVISCLAALRVAPDRFWMYLFVRQMSAQLPSCSPGSVVRMLGGLATLGYRLPDHVLLQVERQIGTAAAMVQLRTEECVEVVRSVAVLRAQQTKPSDAWLQGLLAAAVRGSRHLSASGVIGLLAATAALGLQLEPSWMDVLLLQARSALSAMTPHEHVTLLDALSQQQHQYRPGPVFMSVFLAQVATHLPELTVSQQTVLATGLATVGYKPGPSWMSAFMAQLLSQPVTGADGDDLLQVLRALRRMQYVPAPNVAQQLSGLIDSIQLSVPYNVLLLLREALDELQYQRGIMALPVRQQQQQQAAPESVSSSSAIAPGVAAAEQMPPSAAAAASATYAAAADVVAIDGVVDPAAVAAAAAQQQQAARDGSISSSNGNSSSSGDEDATVYYSRTAAASADASPSAPAGDASGNVAEPGTAAVGTSFTAAPTAAAEGEGSQQKPDSGQQAEGASGGDSSNAGSSKATGVAQESLELFA